MKKFLMGLLLASYVLSTHAFDNVDCKLSKKANADFLSCENKRNGYVLENQKVNEIEIKYKDEKSSLRSLTIDDVQTVSDFNNPQKLKSLLEKRGVLNTHDIAVSAVNIDRRSPLFKDPEKLILASGCQLKNPPVVISYPKGNSCDDILCMGSAECIEDSGRITKDAICKAIQTKEGVFCPSARECLIDKYVSIHPYNSGEKKASIINEGNSGNTNK